MDSKQALELFSSLGKRLFGDKFDYSKSSFRTLFLPVIIICPIHGEFSATPMQHLMELKTGCPNCEE